MKRGLNETRRIDEEQSNKAMSENEWMNRKWNTGGKEKGSKKEKREGGWCNEWCEWRGTMEWMKQQVSMESGGIEYGKEWAMDRWVRKEKMGSLSGWKMNE